MLLFWPFVIAKQVASMTSQGWVNTMFLENRIWSTSATQEKNSTERDLKWYCPSCDIIIMHLIRQQFLLNIFPNAFLKVSLCKGTWDTLESLVKAGKKLWLNFRGKKLVSKIQEKLFVFLFLANILQPLLKGITQKWYQMIANWHALEP